MNESEVKRQLELLDLMNQAELREKFCDLFGFEPGQTNIANLRRRLAYRIQEIYYGGLSEADRQLLEQIADGDPQANLRYGKNGVSQVCGINRFPPSPAKLPGLAGTANSFSG